MFVISVDQHTESPYIVGRTVFIPQGWKAYVAIHESDFVAIVSYKYQDDYKTFSWLFFVDEYSKSWDELTDAQHMKVRTGWAYAKLWYAGEYDNDEYKAVESLIEL